MPITPGDWFLGEVQTDVDEWSFDGCVWAPPNAEDEANYYAIPESERHGWAPEVVKVCECNHGPDADAISHVPEMLRTLQDTLAVLSAHQSDPAADELADRIVGLLHRAAPGFESAAIKGQPGPKRVAGKCEADGCQADAASLAYSRDHQRVLCVCPVHVPEPWQGGYGHVHVCENCGCACPLD